MHGACGHVQKWRGVLDWRPPPPDLHHGVYGMCGHVLGSGGFAVYGLCGCVLESGGFNAALRRV
eukprot:3486198-Pyramimonas_sp.AAC.1